MKYRLIQGDIKSEFNDENLMAAMEVRGYPFAGFTFGRNNLSILNQQPKFSGLAGPMWDGDAIRYEDWKTYEELSR